MPSRCNERQTIQNPHTRFNLMGRQVVDPAGRPAWASSVLRAITPIGVAPAWFLKALDRAAYHPPTANSCSRNAGRTLPNAFERELVKITIPTSRDGMNVICAP